MMSNRNTKLDKVVTICEKHETDLYQRSVANMIRSDPTALYTLSPGSKGEIGNIAKNYALVLQHSICMRISPMLSLSQPEPEGRVCSSQELVSEVVKNLYDYP